MDKWGVLNNINCNYQEQKGIISIIWREKIGQNSKREQYIFKDKGFVYGPDDKVVINR